MAGGQGVARRGGTPPIDRQPLRIAVADLAQARAALAWAAAAGCPVMLYGQAAWVVGTAYWAEAERRLVRPVVVECGDRAGTVLAALRVGLGRLHHSVEGPQTAALDALIAAHGAERERRGADVVVPVARSVGACIARWRLETGDRRHPSC